MVKIISERTLISSTSNRHTAIDVDLYATGYLSSTFYGLFDNINIGKKITEFYYFDLKAITKIKFFINLSNRYSIYFSNKS